MFVVKIIKEKQILDVKHYSIFQNAAADIGNGNVFENIPDELFDTLGNPMTLCFSEENGISDDFEFRYANGVTVYVGEIFTVDSRKETT